MTTNRSNLVSGAIVLLILLLAVGAIVWALTGGLGRRDSVKRSTFFPGLSPVGSGTEVLFQGTHVGEVVGTGVPRVGLQLMVTSSITPGLSQMITLFPGQQVRIAVPSDTGEWALALPSLTEVTLHRAGSIYRFHRGGANRWEVDQSKSRDPLTVNGAAVPRKGRLLAVQTGDVLAVGPLQVEWQDVSDYGRVDVQIGLKQLRKAAGVPDSATPGFLLGPRSSLGIANGFGLGKPSLRLEPGLGRPALVVADDSLIAPAPMVDLERTVQGMLTYLNSPAALRRSPATRFERVVSDLNLTLAQVAQLGVRLDTILSLAEGVSRVRGGQGMIGRLVLTPGSLESLTDAAASVAAGIAPFRDTTRSVLARLKLNPADSALTRTFVSADRTVIRADTVVRLVGGTLDSVNLILSTVRDSLPTLLGRTSKLLKQGTGTAKNLQGWIPPVAIAGMAVSLTGILKLLGAF